MDVNKYDSKGFLEMTWDPTPRTGQPGFKGWAGPPRRERQPALIKDYPRRGPVGGYPLGGGPEVDSDMYPTRRVFRIFQFYSSHPAGVNESDSESDLDACNTSDPNPKNGIIG